jgi:hypothetical protein
MFFEGRRSLHRVTPIGGPTRGWSPCSRTTPIPAHWLELLRLVRYGRMGAERGDVDELDGKVVAITGGASIGRAGRRLRRRQDAVALADVEPVPRAGVSELTSRASTQVGRATLLTTIRCALRLDVRALPGPAHGSAARRRRGRRGPLVGVPLAGWEWTIGVNLMGVVHPGVRPHGQPARGHVVNPRRSPAQAAPFIALARRETGGRDLRVLAHECAPRPASAWAWLCRRSSDRIGVSRNWRNIDPNLSPPPSSPQAA